MIVRYSWVVYWSLDGIWGCAGGDTLGVGVPRVEERGIWTDSLLIGWVLGSLGWVGF